MNAATPDSADVKVSVAMITYNHERFIAQAIESVLMQQTDFAVELVIGEDCSTDGTRAIVCDYGNRYPSQIRPLLPERNLGMIPNFVATLNACSGQYVAILEGDDYWTDPHKLQKQVEFLEAHPDHAICFHQTYRLIQATGEMKIFKQRRRRSTEPTYTLDDLVRGNFIPTASIMLRNGLVPELPVWFLDAPAGDWLLLVLYAQHGNIGFIDQVMSVWRVHDGGAWSGADDSARHQMVSSVFETLRTYLGPEYEKQIRAGVSDSWLSMAGTSADRGDLVNGRTYLLRSIAECPLNPDMRILDKLVLLARLYTPSVYRASKRLQARLCRPSSPDQLDQGSLSRQKEDGTDVG